MRGLASPKTETPWFTRKTISKTFRLGSGETWRSGMSALLEPLRRNSLSSSDENRDVVGVSSPTKRWSRIRGSEDRRLTM